MASVTSGISTTQSEVSPTPTFPSESIRYSTLALHADNVLDECTDVAPALHVSTTFRYSSHPNELVPAGDRKVRPPLL